MSEKNQELNSTNEEITREGEISEPSGNKAEKNDGSSEAGLHEFGEAELNNTIQILEKEILAEKDKYLRLYAEFENFRRRTAKERIELINSASTDFIKEVLPLLDDFERAMTSNREVDDIDAVKKGFELLYNKMIKLFEGNGVTPIESKGEEFDPELHEAVAQVPAANKKEKGKVIDVVEKGYKLKEKIIRHPKVVVGT